MPPHTMSAFQRSVSAPSVHHDQTYSRINADFPPPWTGTAHKAVPHSHLRSPPSHSKPPGSPGSVLDHTPASVPDTLEMAPFPYPVHSPLRKSVPGISKTMTPHTHTENEGHKSQQQEITADALLPVFPIVQDNRGSPGIPVHHKH